MESPAARKNFFNSSEVLWHNRREPLPKEFLPLTCFYAQVCWLLVPGQHTMTRINLTSREYKLILRATRFSGDEQQLVRAARQFWKDFERLVILPDLRREGNLEKIEADRVITFCDTEQHLLYDNDYNFRLRQDKDGKREATLNGDKQGDFSRQAAEQAYEIFRRLQALDAWVDSSSPTKTAYVYNIGNAEGSSS